MKKGGHYSRKTLFKEILLFFPDLSFRLSGNKSNNLKYLSFRKSWNNSNNLKSKIGPGILPKRGSKYTFFTMIMSKTFYIPYDLPSSVHFQMGIRAPKRHLFDRQFCVGLLHIFCKNGPKGRGKIFKFWPMSLPLNHIHYILLMYKIELSRKSKRGSRNFKNSLPTTGFDVITH